MPIINMVYKKKKGWKPGANTIAYYPLTSSTTVNDQSGNSKNMTLSGTVTFGDYNGIDCGYFNGGYLYINESLILGANPRTISCWFNRENAPTEGGAFWGMGNASSQNGITTYLHGNEPAKGHYGYGNRQNDMAFNELPTVGSRTLLTVTYSGSNMAVYINGSYLGTPPYGSTTALALNLTSGKTTLCQMPNLTAAAWKGYMSEFIIENKTWIAQEVTDYYNQTKSNYGL